jgi:hypothetical protein
MGGFNTSDICLSIKIMNPSMVEIEIATRNYIYNEP